MASIANNLRQSEESLSGEVSSALAKPAAYPGAPREVRMIETHISRVFLTERHAYKLKKPVQFDFLDFSNLELRRRACFEELFLNRRLAGAAYLCVVPVARNDYGRIAVQGDGVVVDWLVKMKRLPHDRALDVLIRTGDSSIARGIDKLAHTLVSFYQSRPPISLSGEEYRAGIERHVIANRNELTKSKYRFDPARIARLHQAQLRFLKVFSSELDQRAAKGKVIEGHGDLRPEHVYLLDEPVVIDCIEFNREYRTLDIADELAFLSMECDLLGAAGVPKPIIEHYVAAAHDPISARLLDFYRIYRACVRAKVTAIRSQQLASDAKNEALRQAEAYLKLADDYAKSLGSPIVIMMQGSPGTGKSTVAAQLAHELGIEHLQSDAIRRKLFGHDEKNAGFEEGRYSEGNRFRVYEEMHRRAGKLLAQGQSLILDATYLSAHHRAAAAKMANQHGAVQMTVHCHCPRGVAVQRVESRLAAGKSLSEVRPEWLEGWCQEESKSGNLLPTVSLDTTGDMGKAIHKVYDVIREICTPS